MNDNYTGTTFPGGHVEQNENISKSQIRKFGKKQVLRLKHQLCGLYHYKGGVHCGITLYRADRFIGELTCSEEGWYWIPLEELKTKNWPGMEYVLQILGLSRWNECYMHLGKQMDMLEIYIKRSIYLG